MILSRKQLASTEFMDFELSTLRQRDPYAGTNDVAERKVRLIKESKKIITNGGGKTQFFLLRVDWHYKKYSGFSYDPKTFKTLSY